MNRSLACLLVSMMLMPALGGAVRVGRKEYAYNDMTTRVCAKYFRLARKGIKDVKKKEVLRRLTEATDVVEQRGISYRGALVAKTAGRIYKFGKSVFRLIDLKKQNEKGAWVRFLTILRDNKKVTPTKPGPATMEDDVSLETTIKKTKALAEIKRWYIKAGLEDYAIQIGGDYYDYDEITDVLLKKFIIEYRNKLNKTNKNQILPLAMRVFTARGIAYKDVRKETAVDTYFFIEKMSKVIDSNNEEDRKNFREVLLALHLNNYMPPRKPGFAREGLTGLALLIAKVGGRHLKVSAVSIERTLHKLYKKKKIIKKKYLSYIENLKKWYLDFNVAKTIVIFDDKLYPGYSLNTKFLGRYFKSSAKRLTKKNLVASVREVTSVIKERGMYSVGIIDLSPMAKVTGGMRLLGSGLLAGGLLLSAITLPLRIWPLRKIPGAKTAVGVGAEMTLAGGGLVTGTRVTTQVKSLLTKGKERVIKTKNPITKPLKWAYRFIKRAVELTDVNNETERTATRNLLLAVHQNNKATTLSDIGYVFDLQREDRSIPSEGAASIEFGFLHVPFGWMSLGIKKSLLNLYRWYLDYDIVRGVIPVERFMARPILLSANGITLSRMRKYIKRETKELKKVDPQLVVNRVADIVELRGLHKKLVGVLYAFLKKATKLMSPKVPREKAAIKRLLTICHENKKVPPRKPGPPKEGIVTLMTLMSDKMAPFYGLDTKKKALNNLKEWHLKYRIE